MSRVTFSTRYAWCDFLTHEMGPVKFEIKKINFCKIDNLISLATKPKRSKTFDYNCFKNVFIFVPNLISLVQLLTNISHATVKCADLKSNSYLFPCAPHDLHTTLGNWRCNYTQSSPGKPNKK